MGSYMRATTSSEAKKENSLHGGSECDDTLSFTSSPARSAISGHYAPKQKGGIKYNKKTLKNLSNVRSFRRRATKSRFLQPNSPQDSSVCSSDSSPHYLKATSCSENKKMSDSPNRKNVRILMKKMSFKPKNNYVDKATYSSTLKDSKLPEKVKIHSKVINPENYSVMRICRYQHCSLHGNCHEAANDSVPSSKRFIYKKKGSLEKKRSIKSKIESNRGIKCSSDEKKNLEKSQLIYDDDKGTDCKSVQFDDGFYGVQDPDLFEIAFGEMSFPERSYDDSLNVMRKYSTREQEFAATTYFGTKVYCAKCSCEILDDSDKNPPSLSKKRENKTPNSDLEQIPVVFDEITEENNVSSSGSSVDSTSRSLEISPSRKSDGSDTNTSTHEVKKSDELFDKINSTDSKSDSHGDGDFEAGKVIESNNSNDLTREGEKLQFSKPRHMSMWNLIHQHMTSELNSGDEKKPLQIEHQADDLVLKKESSGNTETENQEIEVRKLLAIKLVREAIEKILLPEVQDDQSSVTSETATQQEVIEKKQVEDSAQEIEIETMPSNLEESSPSLDSTSSQENMNIEKSSIIKPEKKAPKHWSNLKKWILLQRFIRALEKVKKFNPKKPQLLPLNPDQEAEKVNLRPQTLDSRKSGEEWMLDYALRQAVNQLAPTQKRKVELLVKAFETVVPPQEESQSQLKSPMGDNIRGKIARLFESGNQETDALSAKKSGNFSGFNDSPVIKETKESEDGRIQFKKSVDFGRFNDVSVIKVSEESDTMKFQETEALSAKKSGNFSPVIKELKESEDIKGEVSRSESGNQETNPISDKKNVDFGGFNDVSGEESDTIKFQENETSDVSEQNEVPDTPTDRKNRVKMWHMIYQHVVSGIAEKIGTQLLDGEDDSSNFTSIEFTKNDALKLVKDAVDEINVPENQEDSSDNQEITEENNNGVEGQKIAKPKNWIKLKKLLLLKRSIKALEKARELNGTEKIDLKPQMTDERKKAEQWMLDYAVQHIVTKLTPSRKRRVSMIVEAFEAVVPFPVT